MERHDPPSPPAVQHVGSLLVFYLHRTLREWLGKKRIVRTERIGRLLNKVTFAPEHRLERRKVLARVFSSAFARPIQASVVRRERHWEDQLMYFADVSFWEKGIRPRALSPLRARAPPESHCMLRRMR